jgi:hypothetical protein
MCASTMAPTPVQMQLGAALPLRPAREGAVRARAPSSDARTAHPSGWRQTSVAPSSTHMRRRARRCLISGAWLKRSKWPAPSIMPCPCARCRGPGGRSRLAVIAHANCPCRRGGLDVCAVAIVPGPRPRGRRSDRINARREIQRAHAPVAARDAGRAGALPVPSTPGHCAVLASAHRTARPPPAPPQRHPRASQVDRAAASAPGSCADARPVLRQAAMPAASAQPRCRHATRECPRALQPAAQRGRESARCLVMNSWSVKALRNATRSACSWSLRSIRVMRSLLSGLARPSPACGPDVRLRPPAA